MSLDPFDAALDLLRRLDPKNVGKNLLEICRIRPEIAEDLLASVDQPLSQLKCNHSGKDYLTCDYNRDGDSFRSPWSNKYDPPLSDGTLPSNEIRELEIAANNAFDIYRDLYYEGGVSSSYFWDLDDGFAGVVLFKKGDTMAKSGGWDSINVFEVIPKGSTAHYKLTTTIILSLNRSGSSVGNLDLSGNLTRQMEKDMSLEDGANSHISNIGQLIEDSESKMRNQLQEVYFGKARDIIGDLRSVVSLSEVKQERTIQKEVYSSLGAN